VLGRAGRAKEVTAVVVCTRPLTMDEIRGRKHLAVDDVLFSPPHGGAPISWDGRPGTFCHGCGGDGDAITEGLPALGGSLEPSDEPALRHSGLSLARLKGAAQAGRIPAYVQVAEKPVLLRKLLKHDPIKAMHIMRVADHCAGDASDDCTWPEDEHLFG
jgi:hypothetical protein